MSDDYAALALREVEGGVLVPVRAKPRSSRERVEGVVEGALVVAVRAAPVDGEANAALVAVLAKALGVPKGDVDVAKGASGRSKTVRVEGLDAETVRRRLAGG